MIEEPCLKQNGSLLIDLLSRQWVVLHWEIKSHLMIKNEITYSSLYTTTLQLLQYYFLFFFGAISGKYFLRNGLIT